MVALLLQVCQKSTNINDSEHSLKLYYMYQMLIRTMRSLIQVGITYTCFKDASSLFEEIILKVLMLNNICLSALSLIL